MGKTKNATLKTIKDTWLPVATALVVLSDKLRVMAIIDGPNTTDESGGAFGVVGDSYESVRRLSSVNAPDVAVGSYRRYW